MEKRIDFKRIIQFIQRETILLKGAVITTLSVISGIFFIVFLLYQRNDFFLSTAEFMSVFGKLYLLIGVLLIFSITKEIHNRKSNQLYFLIPISTLERLMAIWIITFMIYTIVFTVLGIVIAQCSIALISMVSDSDFYMLSIFSESYWGAIAFYFIMQPLFLLGAITFSKNRIGKTLLTILLVFFLMLIFNFLFYGMLNFGYDVFSGEELASEAFDKASVDFSISGKWFFMGVFAPLVLLASYFKLIEKEV